MKPKCAGGILLIIFLCVPVSYHSYQTDVLVLHGNIFNGMFNNPYEVLYVVLYDGTIFGFTTRESNRVVLPLSYLIEQLNERNKTLGDIAIIMHNHFAHPNLSGPDKKLLTNLRSRGFKGAFGIYITATKKVKVFK